MRPRSLHAVGFVVCGLAAFGCQLLSGASSLEIPGESGSVEREGGLPDATSTDAGSDTGAPVPVSDAAADADAGGDAGFLACVVPTGGSFTACRAGGVPGVASCIEYCATIQKCCAEDCVPLSNNPSIKDAEWIVDTLAGCQDPDNAPSGTQFSGFELCANSPLPTADMSFKCCCH